MKKVVYPCLKKIANPQGVMSGLTDELRTLCVRARRQPKVQLLMLLKG